MQIMSKLVNLIYITICLIGFMWQVTEICSLYFKYDVTSHVSYQIPTKIRAPGQTLCYRYIDLLDFDKMNAKHGKKWKYDDNINTNRAIQKTLTIADIFDLTPSTDEAMKSCFFRRPGSYQLFAYQTPKDCNQHFEITKFFIIEFVCYKYQLLLPDAEKTPTKDGTLFSMQELATSPAAAGQMFSMVLPDGVYDKMRVGKFLLHPFERYPYKEIEYSIAIESHKSSTDNASDADETPTTGIGTSMSDLSASGTYALSYFILDINRLEAPFVTNCFDYQKIDRQSKSDCHQRCVKDITIRTMDKVPFSSIEIHPLNLTSISYLDIQDAKFVDELYKMYEMCEKECKRYDCDEYTYFTRVNYRPNNQGLAFNTFIPSEPSIKIASKERLSFAEFFTFILSNFGTWFGISVLALNPVMLMMADGHHDNAGDGNQKSKLLKLASNLYQMFNRENQEINKLKERIRKLENSPSRRRISFAASDANNQHLLSVNPVHNTNFRAFRF